jgi:hypothetical protein
MSRRAVLKVVIRLHQHTERQQKSDRHQVEGEQGPTFRRPLSELKETTGPPLLLVFVDFLREFAKLLGLFVACLYL